MEELFETVSTFDGVHAGVAHQDKSMWRIVLYVADSARGQQSLESLAWAVLQMRLNKFDVTLDRVSSTRFLGSPDEHLHCVLSGKQSKVRGCGDVAAFLAAWQLEYRH